MSNTIEIDYRSFMSFYATRFLTEFEFSLTSLEVYSLCMSHSDKNFRNFKTFETDV